jgi:FkbM family methyltransferase
MTLTRIVQLPQLLWEARGIGQRSLSGAVRQQAARAWIRLNLSSDDRIPNPVRLLGHTISYFRAAQLRWLFRELFLEEHYLFHTSSPQPVIIDCGSNIGISILYFKTLYPAARIVAFEPDPAAFAKLSDNVTRNSLTDITLYPYALSATEGEPDFYRSDDRSLRMSLDRRRNGGERITVAARRLSSFVTEDVDLLKVDVEGAEFMLVQDLVESGKLWNIKQIHLEYHHHIDGDVDALSPLLKLLEDANFGYQVSARCRRRGQPRVFQDIGVYAYRK